MGFICSPNSLQGQKIGIFGEISFMKIKFNKTTLERTLWGIRKQIEDSLEFAKNWNQENNPRDAFISLKRELTYKSDPIGIELLQSFPTLMGNNYWGMPGYGDCDCFTIAYTSICIVKGWPCKIVLAGHKAGEFSHIYNLVMYAGEWVEADLTQPTFASARPYKNYKIILVN